MVEGQGSGMQSDPNRKVQPGAIQPVADDRATAACQLGSQLVAAARRRLEFHQLHLTHAPDDTGSDVGLLRPARAFFSVGPLDRIPPLDPLAQGRRKPTTADGDIGFLDGTLAKLTRQAGGRGPGLGHHDDARNRRIEPADDAHEPTRPQAILDHREQARDAAGRIGRRQAGGLDGHEHVVILHDNDQWLGSLGRAGGSKRGRRSGLGPLGGRRSVTSVAGSTWGHDARVACDDRACKPLTAAA